MENIGDFHQKLNDPSRSYHDGNLENKAFASDRKYSGTSAMFVRCEIKGGRNSVSSAIKT